MNKQKMIQTVEKEMPEFVAEVSDLSIEEVEGRLVNLAHALEEVEEAKEADEALASAREAAKQANAPYVDAKKAIRLKSAYLVHLAKEKGSAG